MDTFSIKWNWEIVDCRSRHILLFATWLLFELPRRVGWCQKVEATMDILNILIICYWLNFDTQDSMICLSNYLLRLCLTPSLVIFFEWAITFLSQRLVVTRHRSLFMKRSTPHFLLGSRKYIGLISDLIVGFSYKPSLNSFFVYDCISDWLQPAAVNRAIFVWPWKRANKTETSNKEVMIWSFHPLTDKTNNEHLLNHFSRSYENRSTLILFQ